MRENEQRINFFTTETSGFALQATTGQDDPASRGQPPSLFELWRARQRVCFVSEIGRYRFRKPSQHCVRLGIEWLPLPKL